MIDVTNNVQPQLTSYNFELITSTINNIQPQPTIDNLQRHWVDHQYNHERLTITNRQSSTTENQQQPTSHNILLMINTCEKGQSQPTTTLD